MRFWSMIPYFEWRAIVIGPIVLQVWGIFVALGIGLGMWVAMRDARRRGLDGGVMADMALWALIAAFLMARVVHIVAYAPAYYLENPGKVFAIWEGGLSSFGGFFGAIVGASLYVWFTRRVQKRVLTRTALVQYLESAAYALPLGYGCGRIGCFLIHDHPGTLSQSFLAVQYPGGSRLDHGMLLSLFGFVVFGVFWMLRRRGYGKNGVFFLPLFLILYGTVRFTLDFFRAWDVPGADARYWMLTPAQYGCLLFIVVGVACFLQIKVQRK